MAQQAICGRGRALRRVAAVALVLALAPAACLAQSKDALSPLQAFAAGRTDLGRDAEGRLQAVLFLFSDHYATSIARLHGWLRDEPLSASRRLLLSERMLGVAVRALGVAGNPNPRAALVELVVLADTEHYVMSRTAPGLLQPDAAARAERVYASLRDQTWRAARRFLDDVQAGELRDGIARWKSTRREVELGDVSDLLDVAEAAGIDAVAATSGGLLGIGVAAQAVERTRLLGERALYAAQRLPMLVGWAAELAWLRVATTPEMRESREHLASLTPAVGGLSDAMNALPAVIEREREVLLGRLDGEGAALLGQVGTTLTAVADALAATRALTGEVDSAVASARALASQVDTLVQRPAVQRLDPDALRALTADLRALLGDLDHALARAAGTADPFDRLLRVGLTLILVACVAVFVTALAYRALAARLPRAA